MAKRGIQKAINDIEDNKLLVDSPADNLPTEYWHIVAEIDATVFSIEQLAKQIVKRRPIEQMVDEATGWDKEQESTLEYWSSRLKLLMALLPKDDSHLNSPLKLNRRIHEQTRRKIS